MNMSAEALRVLLRIVGLTGAMIVPLTEGMVGLGITMITEVCTTVVIFADFAWEAIATFSHDTEDVSAGVIIDVLAKTVIGDVPVNNFDVLTGVDTNVCAVSVPASSEEKFPFCRDACSCWPPTVRDCRAWQA